MKKLLFQKLVILGPGLLGGSIGLAARRRRIARRIVVWGRRPEAARDAVAAGAADEAAATPAEAVRGADLILLCTTVEAMPRIARAMRPGLARGALVTDVGSTKRNVVRRVGALLAGRATWIGSHPMAGGEREGLRAARAELFEGATCIVTPTSDSSARGLRRIREFWEALGGRSVVMSPAEHDAVVALVSHVPHLAAAALVNVVGRENPAALRCAGNGFRDMTRIASGSPGMWTGIARSNRTEICRGLGKLIAELQGLARGLTDGSGETLRARLDRAKALRDEMRSRG